MKLSRLAIFLILAVSSAGLRGWAQFEESGSDYPYPLQVGMEKPPVPKNNPISDAKIALGKFLYFDKRLSRDSTVSCATCHDPKKGWTDQRPVSTGIKGQLGGRSAPTVLNSAYFELQFWDGRAKSLEEQAKGPIANPVEMGFTHEEAVKRIAGIAGYAPYFKDAFGDSQVTIDRIAQAIANFERTVITGNSPYDRDEAGDRTVMADDAARGKTLFFGKARCSICHTGRSFTDGDFHNIGVGMARKDPDLGRYVVSKQDKDRGAFKTPTLRNLADTAPYMHDGSKVTLAEVIDFYNQGGEKNPLLSKDIRPLRLNDQEKKDLIAFLQSLNGDKVIVEEPKKFP